MCTFPTHTPNTTYTYFLIWDSIMRIDIEMLDRLSGVCSHEIHLVFSEISYPHEVPPHIKGSRSVILMDQSRFLECLTSQSIRPNITHYCQCTHTHTWTMTKRKKPSMWTLSSSVNLQSTTTCIMDTIYVKLCIVSERLSDSIAKLIINKYYCFPYKQVDRCRVVFVVSNELTKLYRETVYIYLN